MRKKARPEYILGCADCGAMINSSTDRSFLTTRSQRWKDHVAKDCMDGEYDE